MSYMITFTLKDVMDVLNTVKVHLAAIGIVLIIAVIVMIACRKLKDHTKFMIRAQAGCALALSLVIIANLICVGPMYVLISLAMGKAQLTDGTITQMLADVETVSDEGIVLLENENNILPLSDTTNLNVFGWASVAPNYSGRGSGAASDYYPITSLYDGLENAGFSLNTELYDFYMDYASERPNVAVTHQDWTLPEPPAATYPAEMMSKAKEFSDTAVIVLSRAGTEQADLPTDVSNLPRDGEFHDNTSEYSEFGNDHYLQLSRSERDMVELVCQNFNNVIVVWNGPCAFEMGFVEEYPQIKAALWCAPCGHTGFNSLGKILKGQVNPSGKTADTFVYDLNSTPYFNNIGSNYYDNMDEFASNRDAKYGSTPVSPCFVDLVEGIYVGYRFYETAATEGLIDYDKVVQYPFGYGLSYTSFTQDIQNYKNTADGCTFDVVVTNTGKVAGKDVVEVYYNPPYTNGGIEKASANLIAFDKTDMLEPGASQTIPVSIKAEDMASFDTYGHGCYVLEKGDYIISVNADSHDILDSVIYTVADDIVYDQNHPRSTDKTAATVQFDYVEGDVEYLSRANGFANYAAATAAPTNMTMSEENKANFINSSNYDPTATDNTEDVMPKTEQNNGLTLAELRGADFDDPRWEKLLDQMSVDDMVTLIGTAGYQTGEVKSVGLVGAVDADGPQAVNNRYTGVGSISFPSPVMTACTFNTDLAHLYGSGIGAMADEMEITGWYAPAINLHRSAFGGRCTEYYSEDPLLTGLLAAQAVEGAAEHGVYSTIKHFALNEQETDRDGMLCTWANEQSIRELYLKSFELAVKNSHPGALMCAHNYIGPLWTAGCPELITTVLRDEWGFGGFVITDWFLDNGYMNADQALRAGTDGMLLPYDKGSNMVQDRSATSVLAMRRACKNIMYTTVNSRLYSDENLNTGMQGWVKAMIAIDVVVVVALVVSEVFIFKGYQKRKNRKGE